MLSAAGLSAEEEAAYRLLVRTAGVEPAELAAELGVERRRRGGRSAPCSPRAWREPYQESPTGSPPSRPTLRSRPGCTGGRRRWTGPGRPWSSSRGSTWPTRGAARPPS
ncbi:hypothetical protein [Nonomuraea recticatena]|uniref:hypothetical protein n=1 Tax=Nonomuraea recticatena TaxID=46178 RepID=UPI0036232D47